VVCGWAAGAVRSRVGARGGYAPSDCQQRVWAAKPPQQLAYSVSKSLLKRTKVNTRPDNKSPSELFSSGCAPVGRQSFADSSHDTRDVQYILHLFARARVGVCGCECVRLASVIPVMSMRRRLVYFILLLRFGFFISSRSSSPAPAAVF